MSMPQIPTIVAGTINTNRTEIINLLLASIAMEELSLAHIVNAEAEKIQAVLGTLSGGPKSVQATTLGDLITIEQSVGNILKDVIKKEMLLQFKLQDIISILPCLNPRIDVVVPPLIRCTGSVLTGTVTCNGQPKEGAFVTLLRSGPGADHLIEVPFINPTDATGSFGIEFIIVQPTNIELELELIVQVNISGQIFNSALITTTVCCGC